MALEAEGPALRMQLAEEGLAAPAETLERDTKFMLLRQLYLAQLEADQLSDAVTVALEMTRLGTMRDVAHHDAARALAGLGEIDRAVAQQRLAARAAPPDRRSFHYWSLATLCHQAGSHQGALSALERGERWAHADRPLLRAHHAWISLEVGDLVPGLEGIVRDLEASKGREGYGRFVLGMLYREMGDARSAAIHLRAFLRRNASIDRAKALTLREELRAARAALAEIESD